MAAKLEIVILSGESSGRRYELPPHGLRLGRSSSNDIHISDGELSRNHCMFEFSPKGELTVIDLASANGTLVNGVAIGSEPVPLKPGDEISAGSSLLKVVDPSVGETPAKPAERVDLGFNPPPQAGADGQEGDGSGRAQKTPAPFRKAMVALAALLIVAIVIVLDSGDKVISLFSSPKEEKRSVKEEAKPALSSVISLHYEKIDADSSRIFRYCANVDREGVLSVEFDDIPGENRHMSRRKTLSAAAKAELEKIFAQSDWLNLENSYSGPDAKSENALKSRRIVLVGADGVKEVVIENRLEPDGFPRIRERLEAWVNNELGVQSIQRSRAELESSSELCEELGDAKWEERDVGMGNLSEAIRFFKLAKNDLISLGSNTKDTHRIQEKINKAESELKKRYDAVRAEAERARQIGDWDRAKEEFAKIREMIPSREDDRHREAIANLEDIENRIQSLDKKGKRK